VARLDQMCMQRLGVLPGAGQPGGSGTLIQTIDDDNGRHGTAMGEQDQHQRDQG
jgi:hypothetical protein